MRIKLTLLASLVGTALWVGPADAVDTAGPIRGQETQRDATSDVMRWVNGRLGTDSGYRKAPGRAESDVAWIRTSRGPYAVRVRVHFRELRRVTDGASQFRFAVQGSSGNVVGGYIGTVNIDAPDTPPDWTGTASDAVHPKATWRIDYETNDFYLTVPNTLLGSSTWVRTAFMMVRIEDESSGYPVFFFDNARSGYPTQGPPLNTYGTYGPKVYR